MELTGLERMVVLNNHVLRRNILLLTNTKLQLVDFVKVVTELLNEGLNFEFVQDYQVHSIEKTLDSSQLLLQPTLDEFSEVNLLRKVVSF